MFTPTLDWGSELWTSLLWIAKGWAIAAVATFVILVLIVRFTTWGRQFWRVTRGYFTGPDSVVVWLWLAGLLLMVITSVRLSVLFSFQGNDMMTSFQVIAAGLGSDNEAVRESGADGFWLSMTVFAVLAVLNVALIMLDLIATQRFMLRWRTWLTDQLTGDWLDGKAYYRARFIDDTIDNPDQRIQMDIDIFTTGVGALPNTPNNTSQSTLLFGAVSSIAAMISLRRPSAVVVSSSLNSDISDSSSSAIVCASAVLNESPAPIPPALPPANITVALRESVESGEAGEGRDRRRCGPRS